MALNMREFDYSGAAGAPSPILRGSAEVDPEWDGLPGGGIAGRNMFVHSDVALLSDAMIAPAGQILCWGNIWVVVISAADRETYGASLSFCATATLRCEGR